MRNGALLVLVAATTVLNGLFLDHIPAWRQALFLLLAVTAYLFGRHLTARHDGLLLIAVALPAVVSAVPFPATGLGALLAYAVFMVLPWLAGRFRRQQAELVQAGTRRVAALEREQSILAEQVRLRERAGIAADMHDSLGHELALIALRAGALELAPDLSPAHRDAAAKLRASAVTATDQLRHTVSLLREPGPTPDSLDTLLDRARDAGMTVHLHRDGVHPVPDAIDQTLHRIVREALTNAARHAPGTTVDIRIDHTPDHLTVTTRNPVGHAPSRKEITDRTDSLPYGRETAGALPPAGSGIAGLRQQVGALGGTLLAGPEQGVFTLTACLPIRVGSP